MTEAPGGVTLTGRLAPDERTAAVEVSEYGGRIERLFVSFSGEPVRAGQRIATVYAPDLVVAQEELLQARNFADVNPDLVATPPPWPNGRRSTPSAHSSATSAGP